MEDPYEEINCPAYFEKGFAGALTLEFDDEFFNVL